MVPLLSSLAASASICVVSALAIALLVITLYILGTAGSLAVFCIREFTQRAHDRPPLIGTVFRQLNNFDKIFDEHVKYALLHPTIRLVYPGHSEILTADPAVIEHVLKTNFSKYSRVVLLCSSFLFLLSFLLTSNMVVDGSVCMSDVKLDPAKFKQRMVNSKNLSSL